MRESTLPLTILVEWQHIVQDVRIVPIMPLCKTCLSIPFFSLPVFPDWLIGHAIVVGLINYIDNGKAKGRKLGQPHHQSHEALRASADACAMCRLIERSLSTVTKIYETKASGSSAKYLNPVGPPSGQLYICERSGGLNGFVVLSPGTHKEVYMVAAAAFCVDSGKLNNVPTVANGRTFLIYLVFRQFVSDKISGAPRRPQPTISNYA